MERESRAHREIMLTNEMIPLKLRTNMMDFFHAKFEQKILKFQFGRKFLLIIPNAFFRKIQMGNSCLNVNNHDKIKRARVFKTFNR